MRKIVRFGGKTYVSINKNTAQRQYEMGRDLYLCPCKTRPLVSGHIMSFTSHITPRVGEPFENVVNRFVYYNCNSETGRYLHYYIELNNE